MSDSSLPPAGVAIVSLQHEMAAETEQGDADGGTTDSGSSEEDSGSSSSEDDSGGD
jgi:hypothetical protein